MLVDHQSGLLQASNTVAGLLKQTGYSLQSVRKKLEGANHEDRDLQFRFINNSVTEFQEKGNPVVSIDAKKKELIVAFHKAALDEGIYPTKQKISDEEMSAIMITRKEFHDA